MSRNLIPNPPSHEKVLASLQANASTRKFDITQAVRDAVVTHTSDPDHYQVITDHLKGGRITGNKVADAYNLAEHLVEWEAEIGNSSLRAALQRGEIQLNAIVKRLPSVLRKQAGMDVQAWVCVGEMIEHDGADVSVNVQVVNG